MLTPAFRHLSHSHRCFDAPSRYDSDLRTEVTWPSDRGVLSLGSMVGKPSRGAKITLPNWAKYVLRILRVVNATIALVGMIWEVQSAHFFLFKYADPFRPSSFQIVIAAMTLVNLAFDTVLFVTAIRFIQA